MTAGSVWAPAASGRFLRLPHGLLDDHRLAGLPPATVLLFLRMAAFADQNETDGIVTVDQLRRIAGAPPSRTRRALDALILRTLLTATCHPEGWQVAGLLDAHKSRSELAELRRKRALAGRKGGHAKAAKDTPDPAPPSQLGQGGPDESGSPYPYPYPSVQPDPRDTHGCKGGDEPIVAGVGVDDIEVVELADRLMSEAGIIGPGPRPLRVEVARALAANPPDTFARSAAVAELVRAAIDVSGRDLADPVHYLTACVRRRADHPGAAAPSSTAAPGPQHRRHPAADPPADHDPDAEYERLYGAPPAARPLGSGRRSVPHRQPQETHQ